MKNKDCLLCGVGGQGTILASKLIADCALLIGTNARASETIGMSQRGGSVVSHVRMGTQTHSPMIPLQTADVIIAFEPSEAVRCLPYLSKHGVMVVSQKAIKPVTSSLNGIDYDGSEMLTYLETHVEKLIIVDGESLCNTCGSSKVLNTILLGAAIASDMIGFTLSDMETAIKNRLPEKFIDLNIKALNEGAKLVRKDI